MPKLENAYNLIEQLIPSNNSAEDISTELYYDMLYNISTKILSERQKKSATQKEFGDFMGVSQVMISKWESGDYNFSVKQICDICAKLNITPTISFEDKSPNIKYNSEIKDNSLSILKELVGAA